MEVATEMQSIITVNKALQLHRTVSFSDIKRQPFLQRLTINVLNREERRAMKDPIHACCISLQEANNVHNYFAQAILINP